MADQEPLRPSASIRDGRATGRFRQERDKRYQDASAARQVLDSEQQVRDSEQQVRDAQLLQVRGPGVPSEWETARLRTQDGRQTGQEFRQAAQRLRIASQMRRQEKQVRDRLREDIREAVQRAHERPGAIGRDAVPEPSPDRDLALRSDLDDELSETGQQRQETERQRDETRRQRADMQRQRAESRRQRQELHGRDEMGPGHGGAARS